MKLALVTETFPPEVNGVAMTLGRLCSELSDSGWSIQVVRPIQDEEEADVRIRSDRPFQQLLVPGVPLPGYKGLRLGEPAFFTLRRSWKENRPDLIHIATEGPLGIAALLVGKQLELPILSTYHTNFDQYSGHYRIGYARELAARYLRVAHNACGATLAPTQQMADELAAAGYRNTGVLSRGVDTDLFSPSRREVTLRQEWGVVEGGRVAVYVGRVAREKNIDLALETFRRLREEYPRDAMVVVGDGPERDRLERAFPEVIYAGMRQGQDLARHFASSDYFLFPSVTETFGNVVTEAMASGVAVVTYDYAAGRAFIENGSNGFLAKLDDPDSFYGAAKALRELDDDAFARLRGRARQTAEGISWASVAESYRKTAAEVIASHRGE